MKMKVNMNFDIWNEIFIILGYNGIENILNLGYCNKYFWEIFQHTTFWVQLCNKYNFSKPKSKATKLKIYKDIIYKNKNKFCELCWNVSDKTIIPFMNYIPFKMYSCLNCRIHHVIKYKESYDIIKRKDSILQQVLTHKNVKIDNSILNNKMVDIESVIRDFCLPKAFIINYIPYQRIFSYYHKKFINSYNVEIINLFAHAYYGNVSNFQKCVRKKKEKAVKNLEKKKAMDAFKIGHVRHLLKKYNLSEEKYFHEFYDYILHTKGTYYQICLNFIISKVIRQDSLEKELEKLNLSSKINSQICQEYIMQGEKNITEVLSTIIEMDWLFKNTDFEFEREYLNEITENDKRRCMNIWIEKNNNNIFDCPETLRKYIEIK